jgi:hypothetical protein
MVRLTRRCQIRLPCAFILDKRDLVSIKSWAYQLHRHLCLKNNQLNGARFFLWLQYTVDMMHTVNLLELNMDSEDAVNW